MGNGASEASDNVNGWYNNNFNLLSNSGITNIIFSRGSRKELKKKYFLNYL